MSFDSLLAAWPELAGFAGAAVSLSSLAPEVVQERIGLIGALAASSDAHDAELFRAQRAWFQSLFDARRWTRNPDVLSEWSALLLRQALDAPGSRDVVERMNEGLASMGPHLRAGRGDREHPDPRALDAARETAEGFAEQLEGVEPLVAPTALADARRAIVAHREWLASLSPSEPLEPLRREALDAWLERRLLPWSSAETIARAEAERARLGETPIPTEPDIEPARILDVVREELVRAAADWHAAGLPECPMPFEVLPTPEPLRPTIPLGAVFTARPLRPEEHALVLLSVEAEPRGRSRLSNFAIHEGAPGHGLQAHLANLAQRPWRALDLSPIPGHGAGLFAGELMEGWAHFAEERVAEMRAEREPLERGVQRAAARWRVARALADLRYHRGELSEAAAIDFLVGEARISPVTARAEVDDFRLNPTYGLSYLVGRLLLRELRAATPRPEAELYRRVLSEGLVPLGLSARWLGPWLRGGP